jgi:hypothetical protein
MRTIPHRVPERTPFLDHLPLFDWAAHRPPEPRFTAAGRWLAHRVPLPPHVANLAAELAGLGPQAVR